jgi:hypothetical protein
MTEEDLKALAAFKEKYPSWWFTIGVCDLTRDFSTAPQERSPEAEFIVIGNDFDCGFHCDHEGSIADAIRNVMDQIELATKSFSTTKREGN